MHFSDDNRTKNGDCNSTKVMMVKTKIFTALSNVLVLCNLKDDRDGHDDKHITTSTPGTITTKCGTNSKNNKSNVQDIDIDLNMNLFIQSLLDKSRCVIKQHTEDFILNLQNNKEQDNENESSTRASIGHASPTFSSSSIDSIMMPPLPPLTHGRSKTRVSIALPPPLLSPTTSPMITNTTPKHANATDDTIFKNKNRPALASPPLQHNHLLT